MKKESFIFFLSGCLLLGGSGDLPAKEKDDARVVSEDVEISREDLEVIRMMELLEMMELLKDMDFLQGEKIQSASEDEKK